jgi:hypothetical protein
MEKNRLAMVNPAISASIQAVPALPDQELSVTRKQIHLTSTTIPISSGDRACSTPSLAAWRHNPIIRAFCERLMQS